MKKILLVAAREFVATVFTRAFILGLVLTPAIGAIAVIAFPRLMTRSVQVQGEIAVVDPSGAVAPELTASLSADRIRARRAETARQVLIQATESVRQAAGGDGPGAAGRTAGFAFGAVPEFTLFERAASADPQQEKAWLTDDRAVTRRRNGGGRPRAAKRRGPASRPRAGGERGPAR